MNFEHGFIEQGWISHAVNSPNNTMSNYITHIIGPGSANEEISGHGGWAESQAADAVIWR